MKIVSLLSVFFTVIVAIFPSTASAQGNTIVLSGSTTVNNLAFLGREKKLSEWSDVTFTVKATSSGRGLVSLAQNEADIGMISSELDVLLQKLKADGYDLQANQFTLHKISETRVVFGVHKDNPIKTLTRPQVKALFLGQIKDWDELGVKGIGPVLVVTEHPTGGVYNTVVSKVLDGEPITKERITMQNGPQVGLVISQNLGGFGMISDATPRDQLMNTRIVPTPDVLAIQRLYLVTRKGDKRPDLYKLIQFVQNTYDPQ